jgi:Superfamily I DNA and RNA helicases
MRERARALVGARAAGKLAVSTFHSLGVRILREHGERLGLCPTSASSTATTSSAC